jgi:hypothetical protein
VIGYSDRLNLPTKAQAEYVVLDTQAVVPTPVTDLVAASTLPLDAFDPLDLHPGRTLLVTGAAGAVGGFAVGLAVARGLRVADTLLLEDVAEAHRRFTKGGLRGRLVLVPSTPGRHQRRLGPPLSGGQQLHALSTVDGLTNDVRMPGMPSNLLDEVEQNPPHRPGLDVRRKRGLTPRHRDGATKILNPRDGRLSLGTGRVKIGQQTGHGVRLRKLELPVIVRMSGGIRPTSNPVDPPPLSKSDMLEQPTNGQRTNAGRSPQLPTTKPKSSMPKHPPLLSKKPKQPSPLINHRRNVGIQGNPHKQKKRADQTQPHTQNLPPPPGGTRGQGEALKPSQLTPDNPEAPETEKDAATWTSSSTRSVESAPE